MAVSSRLANMGFMKRAAAKNEPRAEEPDQPARVQHKQQHRPGAAGSHPAAKVEQRHNDRRQAAAAAEPSSQRGREVHPQDQQQDQQQHSEGKQYHLSDNITNMKFMQRAQLKRSREEAFDREQAAKDASEWVAATAMQDRGCLILHERDPLPAGANGRMSFGFGHFHELQQAEEAERQAAAEAAAEAAAAGAQVQDEEMAGSSFGSRQNWGPNIMRTKDTAKRAARDAKRQRR